MKTGVQISLGTPTYALSSRSIFYVCIVNVRVIHMYYIYFLRSQKEPLRTYIGYTAHIEQRLETHNAGGSEYTRRDRPWELVSYVAFVSEEKALDFEKRVKSGSANLFVKKNFW